MFLAAEKVKKRETKPLILASGLYRVSGNKILFFFQIAQMLILRPIVDSKTLGDSFPKRSIATWQTQT